MNVSEIEDEPEPFESSEEESNNGEARKKIKRRITRITKKPRKALDVYESTDSEAEKIKPKSRNVFGKKRRNSPNTDVAKKAVRNVIRSNNFQIGSFVILKKDAQVGDPKKPPQIWKIDGKSLLQKYEPFQCDDKIRYKNTSVYTGWSPMNIDEYAPITVSEVLDQSTRQVFVELLVELKSIIREDSD